MQQLLSFFGWCPPNQPNLHVRILFSSLCRSPPHDPHHTVTSTIPEVAISSPNRFSQPRHPHKTTKIQILGNKYHRERENKKIRTHSTTRAAVCLFYPRTQYSKQSHKISHLRHPTSLPLRQVKSGHRTHHHQDKKTPTIS